MQEFIRFALLGFGVGALYAIASQGLIVIYRGSGVLNFGLGAIGMLVGFSLFIRMAIELNGVLPPKKKFSILELNMRRHDVKRLHEELFPLSSLRTTWFVLVVASVMAMVVAVIIAVKPK